CSIQLSYGRVREIDYLDDVPTSSAQRHLSGRNSVRGKFDLCSRRDGAVGQDVLAVNTSTEDHPAPWTHVLRV
ncbi:MAG: hypothetical protein AAFY15_12860, partial [Cyanobacteria bacterium J06648_11]